MKVLVTAGSMAERVDSVRSLANTATGRLGALAAGEFHRRGAEVLYVCGADAARPACPARLYPVEGVKGLAETLRRLLPAERPDCVVHSMAVSDYTVNGVIARDAFTRALAQSLAAAPLPGEPAELEARIASALEALPLEKPGGKLGSSLQSPLLLLENAPKVIGEIKARLPGTILVGFKLMTNVGEQRLTDTARALLKKNRCDFVLANESQNIHGEQHSALLLDETGVLARPGTKAEIATAIADAVYRVYGKEPNT